MKRMSHAVNSPTSILHSKDTELAFFFSKLQFYKMMLNDLLQGLTLDSTFCFDRAHLLFNDKSMSFLCGKF